MNIGHIIDAIEAGDLGCACEWLRAGAEATTDVATLRACVVAATAIAAHDLDTAIEAMRGIKA